MAVRSNSFRHNRNTSSSQSGRDNSTAAGTVPPDFCKHIKYCCLHQNFNSGRLDSEPLDRNREFNESRVIGIGKQFKFSELNTNNYSNFSDDEKSMKFNKNFPPDTINHPNSSSTHSKSLQQNYDTFENRKCNCGKLSGKCKCLHTPYGLDFASSYSSLL